MLHLWTALLPSELTRQPLADSVCAGTFPRVLPMLRTATHGRTLIDIGLEKDLEFISRLNLYSIVPKMKNGIIKTNG
jgi:phosphosulfolactate phosphohydrolase-like enzyme